jgi:hypothetical protein
MTTSKYITSSNTKVDGFAVDAPNGAVSALNDVHESVGHLLRFLMMKCSRPVNYAEELAHTHFC